MKYMSLRLVDISLRNIGLLYSYSLIISLEVCFLVFILLQFFYVKGMFFNRDKRFTPLCTTHAFIQLFDNQIKVKI